MSRRRLGKSGRIAVTDPAGAALPSVVDVDAIVARIAGLATGGARFAAFFAYRTRWDAPLGGRRPPSR